MPQLLHRVSCTDVQLMHRVSFAQMLACSITVLRFIQYTAHVVSVSLLFRDFRQRSLSTCTAQSVKCTCQSYAHEFIFEIVSRWSFVAFPFYLVIFTADKTFLFIERIIFLLLTPSILKRNPFLSSERSCYVFDVLFIYRYSFLTDCPLGHVSCFETSVEK